MAALLNTAPADELGARFPGALAGTIGTAGLTGPDELVIVIGHPAADLATHPDTLRVSHINTAPRQYSTSQFYQFGFAMGAVALLIPMLVLISTATRMAAARREERYAALRLVGATRRQISVIASIDAVLGALFGALLGIAAYAALHPVLTGMKLIGTRFFAADVAPTGWAYPAVLIGVPVVAAGASVLSLYRIGVSPLGVSRRVTPPPPRAWRLILLGIGLPLFCVPILLNAQKLRQNPGPAVLSLILVILGLMVAGPWLTMRAARLLARYARTGPAVLAARRLADNPRAAYRSVSGLVLAVMVGTALAAIVPAAIGAQQTTVDSQLDSVLRAGFVGEPDCIDGCNQPPGSAPDGLPPASAASLITELDALPGAHAVPMYLDHGNALITCADLRHVAALGTCPPGAQSVLADTAALFTDNIASLNRRLPLVTAGTPTTSDSTTGLNLSIVLVSVDSPTTLERARTLLSRYTRAIDRPNEAPKTFAEVAQSRAALYLEMQRAVTIVAGLTLLIAGCSLAVAFSGSIIERKRPFTLLRLAGTPVRALYRVVLLETVVPLIAATMLAAIVGDTVAVPVAHALAPANHTLPLPDTTYYLTLGCGLLLAVALILACLPILSRTTVTDNIRFE
jgi:predicted lysophospholipase L1 biosynthesis ABC-type transport system permease subunit